MTAIIHLAFLRMLLSATRTGKSKLMQAASCCTPWALDSPKLLALQVESIAIQIDTHMHIETSLINWITQKMVCIFSHSFIFYVHRLPKHSVKKSFQVLFPLLIFRNACGACGLCAGLSLLEFQGYVACVLTQISRELEARVSGRSHRTTHLDFCIVFLTVFISSHIHTSLDSRSEVTCNFFTSFVILFNRRSCFFNTLGLDDFEANCMYYMNHVKLLDQIY